MANYKNVANYKPSSGGAEYLFAGSYGGQTSSASRYGSVFPEEQAVSGTEADCIHTWDKNITLIKTLFEVTTNSKATNQTFHFRDDGADATTLTITASTTGTYDTGDISVAVAAGSDINYELALTVTGTYISFACWTRYTVD